MPSQSVFVLARLILPDEVDERFEQALLFFRGGTVRRLPGPPAAVGDTGLDTRIEEAQLATPGQCRLDEVAVAAFDDPADVGGEEGFDVGDAVTEWLAD